jgi:hypothetical protein
MTTSIFIGAIASCIGLWYAWLGIKALQHLDSATEVDKTVGWSLWWCFDVSRYDDAGKQLCKRGQVAASLAVVLWIAVYLLQNK